MSEVHQQDIDDLICENGAEYLSEDDTFNNIVHDLAKALARIKELEGDKVYLVHIMTKAINEDDGVECLREWMCSGEWPGEQEADNE